MAASLNKASLIGHVGKDPEIRSTQDGRKIVNFSMATSESWKDKATGERKERTEWHKVVIFNEGLAGVAERYLRKGMRVYVEGAIRTRKWTDQAGVERYSTEICLEAFGGTLLLLSQPDGEARAPAAGSSAGGSSGGSWGGAKADRQQAKQAEAERAEQRYGGGDLDDEIPFAPEWR